MDTKSRILETALALYNEQGIQSVTNRHIAAEMGISPGNLHYHFRHTDDIIVALYEALSVEMDELVRGLEQAENARQVREQISSEMWEKLNQLYLAVRESRLDRIWQAQPHLFFRSVKEGAHLFQGITDSTLSHGEGWHFIQVGRFLGIQIYLSLQQFRLCA